MKTLYIDCNMGAAGDMLLAALLELHPDPGDFLNRLNRLDIPGVSITRKTAVKCGIKGTQIEVAVHGQHENESMYRVQSNHSHMGLHELEHIIRRLDLPQPIQNNILSVYQLIAEAESYVHGVPIEQIHFHEVGSMDAVADITGVCMLIEELAPKKIIASCSCGLRQGELCPRNTARSRAGNSTHFKRGSNLWRQHTRRVVYAYGRGAIEVFCGQLWGYACYARFNDRVWYGQQGF